MTKKFNKAAAPKINDYIITLAAEEHDVMGQQTRPFTFKRKLADWVASETGCVPAIEIVNSSIATDSPQMLIQCTQGLIDKVEAKFGDEIGGIEHVRKLSDIPPGERNCWKPRHGK